MEFLHTMIRVSDVEASLDFYCNKLGLIEFSRKDYEKGRFTLIFLCALEDRDLAEQNQKPLIELTYNWDKEEYSGGNAPKAVQTALFDYGDALGIAFQIVDDLLDVSGDPDLMGKNIGDDFRERKLTLPFIKAVAKSTADERAFWKRTIEKGDQQEGDLARALELLKTHHAIEDTRQDALQWSRRAQDALAPLPDHPIKALLATLATYVVERIT